MYRITQKYYISQGSNFTSVHTSTFSVRMKRYKMTAKRQLTAFNVQTTDNEPNVTTTQTRDALIIGR